MRRREARLAEAREKVRFIERFVLGELAQVDDEKPARDLQRLVVGLRRKLDNYRPGAAQSNAPDAKER